MILTVLAVLVVVLAPAGIIWLTKKVKFLGLIGAVAVCYVLGLILAVSGLGYDKDVTYAITEYSIPIAIPLILFSFNLSSAKKLAKKSLLSFGLQCVAVMVVASAAFFIANPHLEDAAIFSGMTTGLYTGGTPNLNAIGKSFKLDANKLAMANTSDLIVGGVYFLLLLTVMKPIYSFVLDRKLKNKTAMGVTEENDADRQYADEYTFKKVDGWKGVGRLALIILLAVGCLGISAGITLLITGSLKAVGIIMLGVTALGIAFSFWKPVRETKGTFQAGHYLILVFSLALSMSIDLSAIVDALLPIMLFMACVQTGCVILHMLLCKLCKIDSHTAMITNVAGVYGPAFIPPIAQTLKDESVLVPGLICGIIGYAVGNFLGIGLSSLLLLFV